MTPTTFSSLVEAYREGQRRGFFCVHPISSHRPLRTYDAFIIFGLCMQSDEFIIL